MIGLGTTRLAVSQAARHPMARQAHAELRLDRGMSWERAKEVRETRAAGGLHQNPQNSEILLNFEGCPSFGPDDLRVEVVECDHNVVNLSVWLHCFGRHQISDLLHPQICPNHIRFDRHQTRAKNTCMILHVAEVLESKGKGREIEGFYWCSHSESLRLTPRWDDTGAETNSFRVYLTSLLNFGQPAKRCLFVYARKCSSSSL